MGGKQQQITRRDPASGIAVGRTAHPDLGANSDGIDAHQSTSTSTATGATPILELAAREWEVAGDRAFEAGVAWAEAGAALEAPSDHVRVIVASADASHALEQISAHQREARAWHLGADPAQRQESDQLQQDGLTALNLALAEQVAKWNTPVLATPLGNPYTLPANDGADAIRAVFERVSRAASDLALSASLLRDKIPIIPVIRPYGADPDLDLLRAYKGTNLARDVLGGVLTTLSGRFGYEWLFLFEEARKAGLPEWAAQDLQNQVAGAATYEAHLQDEGRLAVDPEKVDRVARQIRRASDGWGTKESQLLLAEIRNLTRPEREELERIYAIRYGIPLVVQLDAEVKGEEDDELFASLAGDPVRAAIMALENRIDGGDVTPADIVAILREIPPSERKRFQEMRKTDPQLMDIEARILDADYRDKLAYTRSPDRSDKEMLAAWFGGNRAEAEALSLDQAGRDVEFVDQGELPGDAHQAKRVELGGRLVVAADLKRVIAELDQSEDPKALEAAFDRTHDYTLRKWIAASGEPAQRDLAFELLRKTAETVKSGERSAEEIAARVMVGTDEEVLTALKDPDLQSEDPAKLARAKERRARANEVFAAKYGMPWEVADNAMKNHLVRRFDDEEDEAQAKWVLEHGEERAAIVAWKAMWKAGTKEDELKDLFRGKTAAEMRQLRSDFRLYTGRDLDEEIDDETWDGSDDAFDLRLLSMGIPETEEELRAYAAMRQSRYRGGGNAQAVTDWFEENLLYGHSGQDTDRQHAQIEGMFDPATGKLRPGIDPKDLRRVYDWHTGAIEDHQAAKAMVINAIATGVEIVVAALVTVLTGGAAAPWLVLAISGAVGVATKAVLAGQSATVATVAVDTVVAAAAVAMAGVGGKILEGGQAAGQGVRNLAVMGEDALKVGGAAFRQKAIRQAVATMVENGGNAAFQAALADGTWDQGLGDGFLAVFGAALRDAGVSLVSLDHAPKAYQSKMGNFLVQTGAAWITQNPDEQQSVAFVIHAVLRAGASAAQWKVEQRRAAGKQRVDEAHEEASHLDAAARERQKKATKEAFDLAMNDPALTEPVKEKLRKWFELQDTDALAVETAAGVAAPDALEGTRGPATPRSSAPQADPHAAPPAAPGWNLRHTGQRAMHEGKVWMVVSNEADHFVLMRRGENGAPVILTVDSEKLLHGTVNDHLLDDLPDHTVSMSFQGTDKRSAGVMYEGMIADDPSREAGVYFNRKTGQYITIQGEKGVVQVGNGESPAPAGVAQAWKELLASDRGHWELVRHYHPTADPKNPRLTQFPSDGWGDMGVVLAMAEASGKRETSLIDTVAPWGERTVTVFGYDPRSKRFFVRYEESKGNPVTLSFDDLAAYHAFLAGQGGPNNPVPPHTLGDAPKPKLVPPPRSSALADDTRARLATGLDAATIDRLDKALGAHALGQLAAALPPARIREVVDAIGAPVVLALIAPLKPEGLRAILDRMSLARFQETLALGGPERVIHLGAAAFAELGATLTAPELEALCNTRGLSIVEVRVLGEQPNAGASLRAAATFLGGVPAAAALLQRVAGVAPPAALERFLAAMPTHGWRNLDEIDSFFLNGAQSGARWNELLRWADILSRRSTNNRTKYEARVTPDPAPPYRVTINDATGTPVTISFNAADADHVASGHTWEFLALVSSQAEQRNSLFPEAVGRGDIETLGARLLAHPDFAAIIAASRPGERPGGVVDGHQVFVNRVNGAEAFVTFYPLTAEVLDKAALRAVMALARSR